MAMAQSDQTCSICMDGFTLQNPRTELECGHGFHARCIIDWFRSSTQSNTCPLCRADPSTVLTYPDTLQRCALLRRKARASNAPPELKKAVDKIRKAESAHTQLAREYREFNTAEIRKMLHKYRELNRKKWAARRAVAKAKRELGLQDFPGLCIMPLVRTPYRLHRSNNVYY